MKFISTFFLICFVVLAGAESTFLIAFPKSGAHVRETCYLSIPKSSIPKEGYVGFWANGKFIGSFEPVTRNAFNVYSIDTKSLQIPDGKLKLEAVLFLNRGEQVRAIKNVSVNLVVANRQGITVPQDGLSLRYQFKKSDQLVYDYKEYVAPSGKDGKIPVPINRAKLFYFTENTTCAAEGAEALFRMSVYPIFPEGQTFDVDQLLPVYLKMDEKGKEVFGTLTHHIAFNEEHKTEFGLMNTVGLLNSELWPILPDENIKVGQTWKGAFLSLDPKKISEQNATSITALVPAQAKFESVEWEQGRACAKLSYQAKPSSEQLEMFLNRLPRFRLEVSGFRPENVTCQLWFDFSAGSIIRIDKIYTGQFLKNSVLSDPKSTTPKAVVSPRPGGFVKTSVSSSKEEIFVGSSNRFILHTVALLESR